MATSSSARKRNSNERKKATPELESQEKVAPTPSGLRTEDFGGIKIEYFHENLRKILKAFNSGDFSSRMPEHLYGTHGEISTLLNAVIAKNQALTQELMRVSGLVGREGRLSERASLMNMAGLWAKNVDSVNSLIGELARPTTEIARVIQAVAKGDLSQKINVEARGEIKDLKETINTMVDTLRSFSSEVTRVAKEVGTEGKLGGQADVKGVSGTWKELTDNVNGLASNLTDQVRNIAKVTTAVAMGDLSQKITVEARGEILELKNTINTMVDRLNSFAAEVTRVAREVGTEGRLGVQADVKGVSGTWKDLTDNVNTMAANLTVQLRDVSKVATAIATGDLTQKITVDVRGEILQIKDVINKMVDTLSSFSSEVTRVAREVGTEGKLGVQADVKGVAGTWKDLTDNVNTMAANLTVQLRDVSKVATAIANGNLEQKITVEVKGEILQIKEVINKAVDTLRSFSSEVTRVAREVGTEGKLGGQADVKGVAGTWKDLTDNVNMLAGNLTAQVRNIAKVTTAVAKGDLSQKITVEAKGEILALKETINIMVDQLNSFASEVTRVAREVGTEGRLGGQAQVHGVSGTWRDLTENVNQLAGNLTDQVRNIAQVTKAVASGDLSKKITVEARGEIFELKDTINTMVEQLRAFASEVTRVAKEVGVEGKLGGQAQVPGVAGTWKDLTDNVNQLAANLTNQVRNIALVTTSVANGDLSKQITVEAKGEILELKDTINTMVDQLRAFASEVTRVAREVGTEGNLGVQAEVKGVAGTWKDLTDNVNILAGNLTNQVRNIALVTTAVANGDLSQKITVRAKGEVLELKNTINTMVDQLRAFASEVTRVAREVGSEGKLGAQAEVAGVSGTWKDLTDSVNFLAGNLTAQVRNIAAVTTAVAKGDLSKKITVEAKGEILQLKDTINTMVDQLNAFAAEVTRVARQVGTEGKLGAQAEVSGVSGTWGDLTENVNILAGNLTAQVRNIAAVTTAVATGDLSKKITVEAKGEILELKETINTMVDQLRAFASEVTRVAKEVGIEGRLGGQAQVLGVAGTWRDLTENVNQLAANLTNQVRNIALVTKAVASGDLSQKITVEARGEILELKDTINRMVDQLNGFAAEVTRVAREVGTEGKLGGQAQVPGVAGTWKDLTDNVNVMASNLTSQVRGIAKVVTAVAQGDLSQKLMLEAKGEIAALADTINGMTDTLRIFADQVTTVAREVGIEGRLGGQARVPGAAGTWRDLTDNVNQLAGNLTTQVRAIAEVATAVTRGDLTRSITVGAQGEVQTLKENINQMIANLRDTTHTNKEQDWLKTNLAKFTGMLQGQRTIESLSRLIMSELTPVVSAQHGAFFVMDSDKNQILKLVSSYAYDQRKGVRNVFALGDSLVGQSALEKQRIVVQEVPSDYVHIGSGLGDAPPKNIVVLPVVFEDQVKAVIELGSFQNFSPVHLTFLDQLAQSIGVVFNMIGASMRTEELLNELQKSNVELEGRSKELEDKAKQLELKNQEVEKASQSLEEKAKELSQISKYKSDFLANMSHELRTPLNSLLILAKMLADNPKKDLPIQAVEYARTIYSSGHDLLALINEILDLSKIEAGKMHVEMRSVPLTEVKGYVERTFVQIAKQKGLNFQIRIHPDTPPMLTTDILRLQQILKNLLANAFKFTDNGHVYLDILLAKRDFAFKNESLKNAKSVLAFSVSDTGIGIPKEKQQLIWEAFQQADTTTARKYGGTGLGLTISRELAKVLGGEIWLKSIPQEGSTFTLFLPGNTIPDNKTKYENGSIDTRSDSSKRLETGEILPDERPFELKTAYVPNTTETTHPKKSEKIEASSVQSEETSLAGRKILVIDDDVRNLFAVTNLLEGHDAEVVTAESAQLGLDILIRDKEIDLVLMDIMMPEMDGYQATEAIRKTPGFESIPVVALTAKAMAEDRQKCIESGCSDFVPKPVDNDKLLATIKRWVDREKEI